MNPRVRERERRRLKKEESAVLCSPENNRLRVLLAFPAPYHIAMSSLGFQLVYRYFNDAPGTVCHRTFLPDLDLLSLYQSGNELLRSFEISATFSDYDLIAFSLNYEHQVIEMLRMLRFGHIPLSAEEREPGIHPLVIAGGVIPTINPEPLAPFVDACVLGEGEDVIREIASCLGNHWSAHRNRHAALEALRAIRGIYIPSYYDPRYGTSGFFTGMRYIGPAPEPRLERRTVHRLDHYPGETAIHTPDTEFGGMHIVEVSRGCLSRCLYCLIPGTYPPFRYRSISVLKDILDTAPDTARIGLLGAGISFLPYLTDICQYLVARGKKFSISSLYASEITETLAQTILDSGSKTITFAPETGSEKKRQRMGKSLLNEQLFTAVERLGYAPLRTIKLYFMVGLPGETEESVASIADFCKHVHHIIVSQNKGKTALPRVVASVSCFVPKPGSSFERAPMDEENRLKTYIQLLDYRFRKIKSVRWTHDVPKWAVIQGLIARGDRRIGLMLRSIVEQKTTWRTLLRTMPINPGFIIHRKRPLKEPLPWYHLKKGFA